MFGRMMIEPVVQVDPTIDLQTAVATLIKITENVEIVRWIEFPASFLLFLLVLEIRILGRSMSSTASTGFGTPSTSTTNSSAATAQPSLTAS